MKLNKIGEFGLIDKIKKNCINDSKNIIQGIGDDCSVCRIGHNKVSLLTTDLLIENVHFLRNSITPFDLGYKSLAVNLSDIAAMGGIAKNVYVSVAIPETLDVSYLIKFIDGIKFLAKLHKVNLLGGDTTSSKNDFVINISVTGEMLEENVVYRKGAQEDDYIYITAPTGNSGIGLGLILGSLPKGKDDSYFLKTHFSPFPYLEEGKWLANQKIPRAMIDVSDGLSSDLGHICQQSKVGAILYEAKLPLSKEFKQYINQNGLDPLKYILNSGEDYVLLFTVKPELAENLGARYKEKFNKNIYQIGRITKEKGIKLFTKKETIVQLEAKGWNHFKNMSNDWSS